ncbi:MAG: phage Gp19/Gp15/Gp42 family protein [Oscillospiraceae bacterium]|nr:phage Gp19/Gp15/Gp42 family protein [Oscillospiraceae bacterium]
MSEPYATAADILAIGRSLTSQKQENAEVLITQASAKLRLTAKKYNKDIDAMIADPVSGQDYALAVKSVIVQAVCRALDSVESSAAVSQSSETLGPYSYNFSYLNAGQSLYFLRNELKDLGLVKQWYGPIDLYCGGGDGT